VFRYVAMLRGWLAYCVALASVWSVAACPVAVAGGSEVDQSGQSFVQLTLRLGALAGHEEEVDSYFGPPIVRTVAQDSVAGVKLEADSLLSRMRAVESAHPSSRGSRLLTQIRGLDALLRIMEPDTRASFESEARGLYIRSVPTPDGANMRKALAALASAVPGPGPLAQRVAAFYQDFVVPEDRRRLVFERALQECRKRTLTHWQLPPAEKLDVEWTGDVPAAWHRYRGGLHSTLQVNPDAVALVGSSVDVACHEAYPGHHAQFVLQDQKGLAVEDQVVLLRSPASVLREGAANFGVEIVFPFEQRVAFDEHVLFPLAGLDPRQARHYETVHRLVDQLSVAAVPIIAAYHDHRLSAEEAEQRLTDEALITSPGALLAFEDRYGAYVLGYTAARDSVRDYIHARSRLTGKDDWVVLSELVSDPWGNL
jgi:hypothetical protein